MTSLLQVRYVPAHLIHQTWSAVVPFIDASNKYSNGELTMEEVKVRVCDGAWTLVVAIDAEETIHGAAVVQIFNRTDNRVAYVTCIGGKFLANPDTFSQFCDLLRDYGATCIEGSVRKSLMRLWARLGAREKSINVQFAL
jgi:hypothetical protein